ncbi:hypothetical protein PNK_1758 [Candidatus Protochlamydia naegleriophila]|uniref:Uncharacterized protein n=2 Tax=Candidatus Protochlamydia naegleriophila TaxID=389348 RepID=A0A0U5JHB8_9BACT|nr:hypothetical protein PNK_1758 [Candidatus Protochlamydia naegleriophila]
MALMNDPSSLAIHLKDAIRSLNYRRVNELIQNPAFPALSAKELDEALETATPILQDHEILQSILQHPSAAELSPKTVGYLMIAAIREGSPELMNSFLEHPHFRDISPRQAEQIGLDALEFQGKDLILHLSRFSTFRLIFEKHFAEVVRCAIRTKNLSWMHELYQQERFAEIASQLFPDLIRWAFKRRDKRLLHVAIQPLHFDAQAETVLRQALFDNALTDTLGNRHEIEYRLIQLLLKHRDYLSLSSLMLQWFLEKALFLKNMPLFRHLLHHPSYPSLTSEGVAQLLVQVLSSSEEELTDKLRHHSQFKLITGAHLGGILEEAVRMKHQSMIKAILHHPNFAQIPEDSFKRMAILHMQTGDRGLQHSLLEEPHLHAKYGQMIYEAIRRNESPLIEQLINDPILKSELLAQFVRYAETDELFVSHYVIRDILRQFFLTQDAALIAPLLTLSLFRDRVKELVDQSIQFDDENLIENALLSDLLRDLFLEGLKAASKKDRQRLYHLFTSNPDFQKKPARLIQEIQRWNV